MFRDPFVWDVQVLHNEIEDVMPAKRRAAVSARTWPNVLDQRIDQSGVIVRRTGARGVALIPAPELAPMIRGTTASLSCRAKPRTWRRCCLRDVWQHDHPDPVHVGGIEHPRPLNVWRARDLTRETTLPRLRQSQCIGAGREPELSGRIVCGTPDRFADVPFAGHRRRSRE